jgi:hypothetical protein
VAFVPVILAPLVLQLAVVDGGVRMPPVEEAEALPAAEELPAVPEKPAEAVAPPVPPKPPVVPVYPKKQARH